MAVSADQNPDARRLALGAAVNMGIDDVRICGSDAPQRLSRRHRHAGAAAGLRPQEISPRPRCRDVSRLRCAHHRQPDRAYAAFRFFCAFLRAHGNRYDEVLISDVRDVVFQNHPFHGLDLSVCNFYLESAKYTIGTDRVNARWAGLFLKPDEVARIAPFRISCCGVTLGPAAQIARYTEVIKIPSPRCGGGCAARSAPTQPFTIASRI